LRGTVEPEGALLFLTAVEVADTRVVVFYEFAGAQIVAARRVAVGMKDKIELAADGCTIFYAIGKKELLVGFGNRFMASFASVQCSGV